MKVFIIIPCLNESLRLPEVINSIKPFGQIIVVDDGSWDNSYEVAKESGAIALKHLVNRGMGAALETGDRYAYQHGADIAIHFDGDGQHLAQEIPSLIDPIISGQADVVLGSRFLGKTTKTPWLKKWLIFKPLIPIHNLFLGVKLTDAHNGFRALSRQALGLINLQQDRYAHATEIIYQIKKNKLKYIEVPVTIRYYEFGLGVRGGLQILRDLFLGIFK